MASTIAATADYITKQYPGYETIRAQHAMLYLCQISHVVDQDTALFDARFQASVHGPLCRALYDLQKAKGARHVLDGAPLVCDPETTLSPQIRTEVDQIMLAFVSLQRDPAELVRIHDWAYRYARTGVAPTDTCKVEIREDLAAIFWRNQARTQALLQVTAELPETRFPIRFAAVP